MIVVFDESDVFKHLNNIDYSWRCHNEKYYTKKLRPKDAKGLIKIKDAFKKVSADNDPTTQPSTSSQSESLSHESQATDNINKNVNPIEETRSRSHTPTLADVHSESESDLTTCMVPVPDARKFCTVKYEEQYKWLYFSALKQG